MKKLIMSLIAVAVLAGSAQFVFAAKQKVIIEGSTTVLPIAQRAAEDFMDKNPEFDITVRGGGSGVGVAAIMDGRADIGDSSRPMKDAELQKAASKGVEAKAHVVAMDGIVVVLNPSNPIAGLTKKQVLDIYTGKLTNWSAVGGPDGKIIAVSRDTASGTYEAFGALALGGKKVKPDALLQASNQAVASVVSKTRGGIGYIGMGYLTDNVKPVTIDGVVATKQTVLSGEYPYSRPLFMYTNGEPKGAVKSFIDFVLSPEGQKIAEEEGFVALQ